jgi:nucleotide-binding universal stress UspA family protein
MYKRILVTLEHSPTDATILNHIEPLARMAGSDLLLVHVADGWVARNYNQFNLAESDEMRIDREYLEQVAGQLREKGLTADLRLAWGDPPNEIVKIARECGADLIAMSTHGHRFISDLIYGSTADKVRHSVDIPVLLLKAPRD